MPPRRAKTHDADKGATGTAINEDSFNGDVAQEPSYSMARMNEKLDTLLTARTAQDTQLNLIISKVTSLQSEMSLVNGKQKIYRTRFRSMIITIRAPSNVAETHVTKMQTKEEVLCFKFVVHWLKILPTFLTV